MIDDDECGAAGGMNDKAIEELGETLPQCGFVHHKSDMT
jgi:hypothetical protein